MATASNIVTSDKRSWLESASSKVLARTGIVAAAFVGLAIIVPASLADCVAVDHPLIAASMAPWNATAAANAAAALKDPKNPRARALVDKALARDPTQVPALELRGLDLALQGKPVQARQLFELSSELSRRSLPTRLWLIQDAVDRGDVAGALRNFDIALRTTTDAQPILFPVLASALADPTLTVPIARTLDRPSEWRVMFIEWALSNGENIAGLAKVAGEMNDRSFVRGNTIDQRLIERLVDDRNFATAITLSQRLGRRAGAIADPHFGNSAARYPFGWGLVSDGSLSAERASIGSLPVLKYAALPAHSGQVAAQLLVLKPGAYVLASRTAATAIGEAPYWSVTCGDHGGAELAQLDQPSSAGETRSTLFEVPNGCIAQWLTLRVRPSGDAAPQSGAIGWVQIAPR